MRTLQESYQLYIDRGILDKSVSEERFSQMLQDEQQRKAFYDYASKNFPNSVSKDYATFNANISAKFPPVTQHPVNEDGTIQLSEEESKPDTEAQGGFLSNLFRNKAQEEYYQRKAEEAAAQPTPTIPDTQRAEMKRIANEQKDATKQAMNDYTRQQEEAAKAQDEQFKKEHPILHTIGEIGKAFRDSNPATQSFESPYHTPSVDDANIKAASQLLLEADNTMAAAERQGEYKPGNVAKGMLEFGKSTVRTLGENAETVMSFGISDIRNMAAQKNVLDKIAKAEAYDNPESVLSPSEKILYDAIVSDMAATISRQGDISRWATAGDITGEMIPFVAEIALGRGLFGGAAKATEKAMMRTLAGSVKNKMFKRGLANLGETGIRAGQTAATVAVTPGTYAQAIGNMTQADPESVTIENDQYKLGNIQQQDFFPAFNEAFGDRFVEMYTETGGNFKTLGRLVSDVPVVQRLMKSKVGNVLGAAVGKFKNTAAGDFADKIVYNGVAGEWLEELESALYGEIKEDGTLEQFFTADQQLPMLLSFSVPAIATGGLGVYDNQKHRSRYQKAADNITQQLTNAGLTPEQQSQFATDLQYAVMTSNVEQVPTALRNVAERIMPESVAELEQLKQEYEALSQSENANKDDLKRLRSDIESNQAQQFINSMSQYVYEGAIVSSFDSGVRTQFGETKKAVEGMVAEDNALADVYNAAYDITDQPSMQDAQNRFGYQRQRLLDSGALESVADYAGTESAEDVLSAIDRDPRGFIHHMNNSGMPQEQQQIFRDYINSLATASAMYQRVEDDIQTAISESDATIDAHTNPTTGNTQKAVMKQDDRPVFIISGNIVMLEDGSGIDKDKSDSSIIVQDMSTGETEMVSPESIFSAEAPQSAADQKAIAAEGIRNTLLQQADDKFNGTLTFQPNEVYNVPMPDGTVQTFTAVPNEQGFVENADGTINVADSNGNVTAIPKETLQDYADQAAAARIASTEAERQVATGEIAPQAEETTPAEPTPREYAVGDAGRFVILDDNGNPISGVIDEVADVVNGDIFTLMYDDGRGVAMPKEEFEARLVEYNGEPVNQPTAQEIEQPTQVTEQSLITQPTAEESHTVQPTTQPQEGSILSTIPTKENGDPALTSVDAATAWDALLEMADGIDTEALALAQSELRKAEKALKQAAKAPIKDDLSLQEKARLQKANRDLVAQAQAEVDAWNAIVAEPKNRQAAAQQLVQEVTQPAAESSATQPIAQTTEAQPATEVVQENTAPYQLSDEVDENGIQFVLTSDGKLEFGYIDEQSPLTPAPILLSEGVITNPATNAGYGLVHIEARHGEQIRKAGYKNVLEFIEKVAKNYDRIVESNLRDGVQTYSVQLQDEHNNTLMVELSGDGTYWNINTAGIFKTSYGRNRKEVYNRHTTAKQSAETVEESQDAEQSGTQTSSRMDTPTSSADKGTTNVPNVQEETAKPVEEQQKSIENLTPTEIETAQQLAESVKDWVAQFNIQQERVHIIQSVDEIPQSQKAARDYILEGGRVMAWNNGEVYLYLPNIVQLAKEKGENPVDKLKAKVFHELVVHNNLPKMLGQEKWNALMDGVYKMMSKKDKEKFLAYHYENNIHKGQTKYKDLSPFEVADFVANPENTRAAADEYVAHLSEKAAQGILTAEEQSIWDKIVQAFKQALEKIGLVDLTIDDVIDIIGASYANLRENNEINSHIPVLTEEEFLAQNGYGFSGIGEPALHKGRQKTAKQQDKIINRQLAADNEYISKRDELRKEYSEKLKKGELREPTIIEQLIKAANGHPDLESTKAAERSLSKRGYIKSNGSWISNNFSIEDTPTGSIVQVGDVRFSIEGYHGSGADFVAFDHSHIGEGFGSQVNGFGTYVSTVKDEAMSYAQIYAKSIKFIGNKERLLEEVENKNVVDEVIDEFLFMLRNYATFEYAYEYLIEQYRDTSNPINYIKKKVVHSLNRDDFSMTRNLYTIAIPDKRKGNYIKFNEKPSVTQIKKIVNAIESELAYKRDDSPPKTLFDIGKIKLINKHENRVVFLDPTEGATIYDCLTTILGSKQKASEFLSELGFVGIEYETGGRADGAKNYVIFNESDIEIKDHIRFSVEEEQPSEPTNIDNTLRTEQQLALEAVLEALNSAGIDVVQVSDEEASSELKKQSDAPVRLMRQMMEQGTLGQSNNPIAGAKLQKNLETAKEIYKQSANAIKNAISDIARAIGARNIGTSNYVTIEAKNGKIFTLRISNHNATISNFDNNNETEGISIVISRHDNSGIVNNGNAHVVEFFYPQIALVRSEGTPIADIIGALQQTMYSGEYKDPTGLAQVQEVNAPASLLQSPNGTIYGYAKGGKIYLTPNGMNPNTPIHEYTHLWDLALQKANLELWKRGVEVMKQTPLWQEVISNPAYADIANNENLVASEVHARLTGENGASLLEQLLSDARQSESTYEAAKGISLVDKLKKWLQDAWQWVRDTMSPWTKEEASKVSLEEFVQMPIGDLTRGVNPNDFGGISEDIQFATYGGNSGYVGYSISKRGAQAKEEGRFPKSQFKKEYSITQSSLDALVDLGYVSDSEWHHTSMYGNRTTFYAWDKPYIADIYTEHKKEIDAIAKDKEEGWREKIENIFNSDARVQAAEQEALSNRENYRKRIELNNRIADEIGAKINKDGRYEIDNDDIRITFNNALNSYTLPERITVAVKKAREMSPEQATEIRSRMKEDIASRIKEIVKQSQENSTLQSEGGNNVKFSVEETDAEYLAAVERGDMETAQRMVDEAAARAGYTIKAYHGTTAKRFNEFNKNSYFSPDYDYAKQYSRVLQADGTNEPKVYSVYLKGGRTKDVPFSTVRDVAYNILDKYKNDAMLIRRALFENGVPEYIVKNPSQIKSADPVTYDDNGKVIPLSERFNKRNEDIRFSVEEEQQAPTAQRVEMKQDALRSLLGDKYDKFIEDTFINITPEARKEIVSAASRNGWDFKGATEEYLAQTDNADVLEQIKSSLLETLRNDGASYDITDNELRYLLWANNEYTKNNGQYDLFAQAADIAKQYDLKIGNFAEQSTKDDNMYLSGNNVRFSVEPTPVERKAARDRYERRVSRGMFQSQEALQDSMIALKEAMQAIDDKAKYIEEVAGFENAYIGENRLSSVNKAEADAFANILFKPLYEEVSKLAPDEDARLELIDYMMAKHGLERNVVMAERDAKAAKERGSRDSLEALMYEYRQKDYAGLTSLFDVETVEEAEQLAQAFVDSYEGNHNTTPLWEKVNAVSKAILKKSHDSGLMSNATYEDISSMYKYYIPLRGFDEKTSEEAYAYLRHKQSIFNAPIKHARGRKSKADDPFAYLESMAESTIMQGNRNELVKKRFLNFVMNHPSDLVSVSEVWLQYNPYTEEWNMVGPEIAETDTPAEVERKMQEFTAQMEVNAEKYPDIYKKASDNPNIPYRIVEKRDLQQHQVVAKRNGRDYIITVNGNPRLAQALNGQTNPDNDISGAIGTLIKVAEKVNRELSAFYTTRNPDFIVSNFLRDTLYTNVMSWVKESPRYAVKFHKNWGKCNPAYMKILYAKLRNNTLDMSNPTERAFYQFIMNGGETGYANIKDIEKLKQDVVREIKKNNGQIPVRKSIDWLAERLDEYNRAVENCARFAAFLTSREVGRDIDRSIYDAKEISVNFNKKGSGSKFLNATGQTGLGNVAAFTSGLGRTFFVFWNAAIQGTTNFGRAVKRHPAKALAAASVFFTLGLLVAGLGGDDEDEKEKSGYYDLPEYIRRTNIVFRAGDSWISIPLPIEFRAFYGLGELAMSTMSGKEHLTNAELAEAIAAQISQVLPLDMLEGSGGFSAFIPSFAKPIVEAYTNTSWTGLPIYKDNPFDENMPNWTKAYKSANKHLVNLAAALNEATGGNDYKQGKVNLNPERIEYLLNGYFGGVFSTIDKLTKTAETIIGDREYDPRSILLLNRVVKRGDERTESRANNNEYFRLKEEHDEIQRLIRNYERDTDSGKHDYSAELDEIYSSPEFERYEIFHDYMNEINSLNRDKKEAPEEDIPYIDAEIDALKAELLKEIALTRK